MSGIEEEGVGDVWSPAVLPDSKGRWHDAGGSAAPPRVSPVFGTDVDESQREEACPAPAEPIEGGARPERPARRMLTLDPVTTARVVSTPSPLKPGVPDTPYVSAQAAASLPPLPFARTLPPASLPPMSTRPLPPGHRPADLLAISAAAPASAPAAATVATSAATAEPAAAVSAPAAPAAPAAPKGVQCHAELLKATPARSNTGRAAPLVPMGMQPPRQLLPFPEKGPDTLSPHGSPPLGQRHEQSSTKKHVPEVRYSL